MYKMILPFIIGSIFFMSCNNSSKKNNDDVLNYVNPFIGTGGHGHTFPGATSPFGQVQLSPDNSSKGWDWTSGYHYSDTVLLGFSHTHLSGTGVGDLYDILLMPFTSSYPENTDNNLKRVNSSYDHANEYAEAGYYSVQLKENDINVELTATERVGISKYTYPKNSNAQILLDLGYSQNFDRTDDAMIRIVDSTKIIGYRKSKGWANFQPVYFVIEFSKPFEYKLYDNKKSIEASEIKSKFAEAVFKFNAEDVIIKTALSSASIEGAEKNLKAETPIWNFEKMKNQVQEKWRNLLSRVEVKSKSKEDKEIFYTALYHSYIAPNLFSDENHEFYGANGKTEKAVDYKRYTLFSLWDTFRALHPLITITYPEIVDDFVKSLIAFYNESGLLPTWDLMSNDTNVMIGYHAVPVIIDAYLKGLTTVAPEKIYEASKTSAMQNNFGIDLFKEYGYIPSELEVEAVSKVLEYSFDDWCIAQLAKKLGKEEDYNYFMKRANSYRIIFDKNTGFMRGKDKNGKWVKNFDPLYVEHRKTDYTEANAWQYTFHVLQDIPGLIKLFGGEEQFISKLDSLFTVSSNLKGEDLSPDISGLIGQYAHGNEPCHHVAYLYSFTSQPWKTQEQINQIRKLMYKADVGGLVGNDDCGQMSAWYVFSAFGFYPVNPADSKYWFGTPLFEEVSIKLNSNKTFTIKAENFSKENIYIKSVSLNGKELDRNYITHNEIMSGGVLIFTMTSKLNKY